MKKQLLGRSFLPLFAAILIAVSGAFASQRDSKAFISGWAKVEGDCQPAEADEDCGGQSGIECTTLENEYIFATLEACNEEQSVQILRRRL